MFSNKISFMPSVYIEWYGCALNKADTERLRHAFVKAGYKLVDAPEKADYCIVNTCAVKTPTEEKTIARLRKLNELSKRANFKLVVVGCLVEINRQRLQASAPDALLFGVDSEPIANYFGIELEYSPKAKALPYNECISIIPVARGCLNRCTYCCVSIARGRLKSYPIEEIDEAFKDAITYAKEIWLTATDIACYGFDLGTNLSELLAKLLENSGKYRIRVGMLNPQHAKRFFDELLEVMRDERIYKFFHLPVQSGSDAVLRKMARGYKVCEFEELVEKAKQAFPQATIATDIIVGFPGETQVDFEKTIELMKRVSPDVVNVSRYGKRPGTLAARMKQLPYAVVKERSKKLSQIVRELTLEKNKTFVGKSLNVLVSERGIKGNFVARTDSYKPVVVREDLLCRFATVKITGAKSTHLEGTITDIL
jgi:MiaB-like tRNA modifying enzyme